MKTRSFAIACALLLASTAFAMSVRDDDTELARSDDGKTALIERDSAGPEGGGSITYLLKSPEGDPETFDISNTFSPGDGSRPQRISQQACEAALEKLGKRVAGWKAKIQLHPEVCKAKQRSGGVVVAR